MLLLGLTLVTLRIDNRNADGPSILFPGGVLVSGELHSGAEPDWSFTDEVPTIELQLVDPASSRRILIMESANKVCMANWWLAWNRGLEHSVAMFLPNIIVEVRSSMGRLFAVRRR